jgi:hypothetical protein
VSIGHAEFMADRFRAAGIPALAVTSKTDRPEREDALRRLRDGDLRAVFTVDLFNEGIDLPALDTVLLLRPTDSATVFLQQIGRGLRLHDGKACLTVLDFIGAQHAGFRFDRRYRALTGTGRRALATAIEHGFPTLPAGCHIQLDRVAGRLVLDNVRSSLRLGAAEMAAELRELGDVPLRDFLAETRLDIEDVYRRRTTGGWSGLHRRAGLHRDDLGPLDAELSAAIGRMLHIDDPDRLDALADLAEDRPVRGRPAAMAHVALWGRKIDMGRTAAALAEHPGRRRELIEVIEVLRDRMHRVTTPPRTPVPLRVHARYSRDEALTAFGVPDPWHVREGVKRVEAERADLFFVTLVKTEKHYSATTMYQDRAITPTVFQWESQSTTSAASPTGRRYAEHVARGDSVHLFLRRTKVGDGDLGAPPYLYAGPMTYLDHSGDRPMRVRWQLDVPLPADVYHDASLTTG